MNVHFPSELRTMSFVPRWPIVATITKQNVAEHSYYVTLYAYLTARLIQWEGPKSYLMLSALIHDLEETALGDLVGPSKEQIVDRDKYQAFTEAHLTDKFGSIIDDVIDQEEKMKMKYFDEAQAIVKVADRMDALFYLLWEKRLGNSIIDPLIVKARSYLEGAWRALPADEALLSRTYQIYVLNSIKDHENEGGRGV